MSWSLGGTGSKGGSRIYLGQATEVAPTDITAKFTGPHPKFAISEEE